MNMSQYKELCKQNSYELQKNNPNLKHSKLLDLAAEELGFPHFTSIIKLEKLLPSDVAPSRIAIVQAGGNAEDSPLEKITHNVNVNFSQVSSTNSRDTITDNLIDSNIANLDDDDESGFPRTIGIQQTPEAIIEELGYDPSHSENEDSISLVDWEIGGSIEEDVEIDSWSDIPEGYELSPHYCTEKDFEDFNEWSFLNRP